MRKITKDACHAFNNSFPFKRDNTEVVVDRNGQGVEMYLFGNMIARQRRGREIQITSAGYHTVTTKERLNGLPGVSIVQRDFEWYLNGQNWNGDWARPSNYGAEPEATNHRIKHEF